MRHSRRRTHWRCSSESSRLDRRRGDPPGEPLGSPSLPSALRARRLLPGRRRALLRRALLRRRRGEALLETRDQVDHLRLLRLLHVVVIGELLPLELRAEQRLELLLVLVVVL